MSDLADRITAKRQQVEATGLCQWSYRMSPGFVLQDWVNDLPWKQQSILLSGFRGPDVGNTPAVKAVGRWMRRIAQHNADPSKDYMRQDVLPEWMSVCDELEYLTCHFTHHFADALRVVAINHPESAVKEYAGGLHAFIAAEIFHWRTEDDLTFVYRHRDRVMAQP